MTNANKLAAMDAVGELPDFGNILLRECGYPHLPAPTMSQFASKADYEAAMQSQSDAWNEAGTKPKKACFCETYHDWDDSKWFQFWNGEHWCAIGMSIHEAAVKKYAKSHYQFPKWREVQP